MRLKYPPSGAPGPPTGRLRRRGIYRSWQRADDVVLSAWPRRWKRNTPSQQFQREQFALAIKLASYAAPIVQATARNFEHGSQWTYRDWIIASMYGRSIQIIDPDNYWLIPSNHSYDAMPLPPIQPLLDTLTTTPGSLILRTSSQWQGLPPVADNYVLTLFGGQPTWLPASPRLLDGGQMIGNPVGSNTQPPIALSIPQLQGMLAQEQGTWTPTLTAATPGDLTYTPVNTNSYFARVGPLVLISVRFRATAVTHSTASGNLRIANLPVSPQAGSNQGNANFAIQWDSPTRVATQRQFATPHAGSSSMQIFEGDASTGFVLMPITAIPSGTTLDIRFGAIYFA